MSTYFNLRTLVYYHQANSILPHSTSYLPLIRAPFIQDSAVLISLAYLSSDTYSSSGRVFDRHCSTEFMKQVLPMFLKPFSPGTHYHHPIMRQICKQFMRHLLEDGTSWEALQRAAIFSGMEILE
jgi:hypothetical protein